MKGISLGGVTLFVEGYVTSYTPAGFITTETLALNLHTTNTAIVGLNSGKSNSAKFNTTIFIVEATDTKIH